MLSVISLTGVLFVACGVYHSIFTVLEQMLLIVIVSSAAAAAAHNLVHYSATAALGGYGR